MEYQKNYLDTKIKLFESFPPVETSEWENIISKDLKGGEYKKKLMTPTPEGIEIKPYYRWEDVKDYSELKASPGKFPYTRGNHTTRNWKIRQDIFESDLKKANQIIKEALKSGAEEISLYHIQECESGMGQNIQNVSDLEIVLEGIDITHVSIHFNWGAQVWKLVSLLDEFSLNQQIPKEQIQGSFGFDPLSLFLKNPDYQGEKGVLEDVAHFIKLASAFSSMLPLTISSKGVSNAGGTLVQELAFVLGSGIEIVDVLTREGFSVPEALSFLQFEVGIGSHYFFEIAKLRALRQIWAGIVKRYDVPDEMGKISLHACTTLWNKTILDPQVNLLRTTTEAMSAVVGGCDSLSVIPFDLPYEIPNDLAYRLSRNTQLILRHEVLLEKIVDPSAGSYYLEYLTHSFSHKSLNQVKEIELKGGIFKHLKSGEFVADVKKIQDQKLLDFAHRRETLLGTNQYPNFHERILDKIKEPFRVNFPKPRGADELRSETTGLKYMRAAQAYESLRLATEIYAKKTGKTPTVFLWTQGNLTMRKARASFTANLFGCIGYQIIENAGFLNIDEGFQAIEKSNPQIVVICSSDSEYPELVPPVCMGLQKRFPEIKRILAGSPPNPEELVAFGIQDFLSVKTNALQFLKKYQTELGILL